MNKSKAKDDGEILNISTKQHVTQQQFVKNSFQLPQSEQSIQAYMRLVANKPEHERMKIYQKELKRCRVQS